jgi:hypothetical protein
LISATRIIRSHFSVWVLILSSTTRHVIYVDLLPGDRYGAILLIDFAYGNLHRLTVCKLPGKRSGQARSSLFSASH